MSGGPGSSLLRHPLKLRTTLSVILVVLAAASIRIGGGSTPLAMALAALGVVFALRRPPMADSTASRRAWTFVILAALGLSIWRAIALQDVLDSGTDFLLLLCVQRLFNRQRTREHQQIILITSVLLTIGAVINVEVSFPVLLVGYLVTVIFSLIINLLIAEGERLGPRVMYDLERIGERRLRRLLMVSVQVASVVFVGGLAVFIFFPRFGAGVFLRGALPTTTIAGFSNQVQLGLFGTIKNDPRVVMRVAPSRATDAGDSLGWYFRGTSFDRYEAGEWSASMREPSLSLSHLCGTHILEERGSPRLAPIVPGVGCRDRLSATNGGSRGERAVVSTITLEDIGVSLLFLPDVPSGVRVKARGPLDRLYPSLGIGDKFTVTRTIPGPIRYQAISRLHLPADLELAAIPIGSQDVADEFLATPFIFSPQFRALAASLKIDHDSQIGAVRAVLEHLSALEYTLDQPERPSDDPRDPLEYFLFDARAGHCEYFATAAAMLLREMKIPTRLVNGYVGGTLNEYGGFYAVTQADAHSWIEVYFGEYGWVRFDPTPAHGRRGATSSLAFPKLRQYLDALRNKYLAYVIDYNLRTQLDLLSEVGLQWRDQRFRVDKERLTPIVGATLTLLMLLIAVRMRARGRSTREATAHMNSVLRGFAQRGFVRGEAETPQAFAKRVTDAGFPEAAQLESFVDEYERLRFSSIGEGLSPLPASFPLTARRLRRATKSWTPPQ